MSGELLETFEALSALERWGHGFVLRAPGIPVDAGKSAVIERLASHYEACLSQLGFGFSDLVTGGQVHGREVAVVSAESYRGRTLAGVDGLICNRPGIPLGVYVADCCAVFLVDRKGDAFGLIHSGRKGTEQEIVPRAIALMQKQFGSAPGDLRAQLSPCIRPPHYEVDFAAEIRKQCLASGVPEREIFDGGVSTATDLNRYYSYRCEKGKTGRMLAVLVRRG